jgi:hypothetical protein
VQAAKPIQVIHSQISMENKTGCFIEKLWKYKQKSRHLIGQTVIT